MEQRDLGIGGPRLSTLGLGCNNFGMKLTEPESVAVVRAAVDAGVTHFDTAEKYGDGVSEEVLGRALGADRDAVVVASKFSARPAGDFRPGDLARRVVEGCEGSLRRVGTDRIDLYYQHFMDPAAPADEFVDALASLVQAGKVRHVALSNADVPYLELVAGTGGAVSFCAVQTEWSLLAREAERSLVPAARAKGMGVVPYFPLASGLLTGKYHRGQSYPKGSRFATLGWSDRFAIDANFTRVEKLAAFAQERGRSILELAFGWLLSQPGVASVIAGATSPAQVQGNAAASRWRLTAEELRLVDGLLEAT